MISDSSNPSVKNAYPSFSYSIDTSSRTAYRSRRLFYALQQKSSLTHFVAPPFKNKTARPLQASSTTSALRCAGFCFCWMFDPRTTASILPISTTSSRTAVRSRRLFYASQFPGIFQPYYAPNAAALLSSAAAFFAFGALVCPSCPGNRSICICVLRTGHLFIDCFRQRFGIERLLFCLLRKPN